MLGLITHQPGFLRGTPHFSEAPLLLGEHLALLTLPLQVSQEPEGHQLCVPCMKTTLTPEREHGHQHRPSTRLSPWAMGLGRDREHMRVVTLHLSCVCAGFYFVFH